MRGSPYKFPHSVNQLHVNAPAHNTILLHKFTLETKIRMEMEGDSFSQCDMTEGSPSQKTLKLDAGIHQLTEMHLELSWLASGEHVHWRNSASFVFFPQNWWHPSPKQGHIMSSMLNKGSMSPQGKVVTEEKNPLLCIINTKRCIMSKILAGDRHREQSGRQGER